MAKDWTEQNLDVQIQTEITSGEYWQTQADMWRNKYLNADEEIERLRKVNLLQAKWLYKEQQAYKQLQEKVAQWLKEKE